MSFVIACDEPEEDDLAETEEIEGPLAADDDGEEEAEEEEVELAALIEAQNERCQELICDRPFQCQEESEDFDDSPDMSIEECYEENCNVPAELVADLEPTEVVMGCIDADQRASDCLEDLSCDDLLAFVHPTIESDHICADEMAAQEPDSAVTL